jgi:DNA repair exonuclease SbcCD ATPase subunit
MLIRHAKLFFGHAKCFLGMHNEFSGMWKYYTQYRSQIQALLEETGANQDDDDDDDEMEALKQQLEELKAQLNQQQQQRIRKQEVKMQKKLHFTEKINRLLAQSPGKLSLSNQQNELKQKWREIEDIDDDIWANKKEDIKMSPYSDMYEKVQSKFERATESITQTLEEFEVNLAKIQICQKLHR